MARFDMVGFFWDDTPPPKPPKKEKPKAIPPDRFWESPDYLPDLEDARSFSPNLMTDLELLAAAPARERLIFDIEVYPNYCLFAFRSLASRKVLYFELSKTIPLNISKLRWVLDNFCLVNFNGRKYDFPVTSVALGGYGPEALWEATEMIITQGLPATDVYRKFKTKSLKADQIDLIELTPLGPGLKVCAGRLHAPRLQDLPFKPGSILSDDQILILKRYCINDLDNTELLYYSVIKQIELREKIGIRYGLELRSHSDAQMAEAIIGSEIKRVSNRKHIQRTQLPPGTAYEYRPPAFVSYSTPLMNEVLNIICNATFRISEEDGTVVMPEELKQLVINMGNCHYKLGIGGLHSQEKSISHSAENDYLIIDTDATSYYPRLILNAGITPENLGYDFLKIYNNIVTERVKAKQNGDTVVAECLKIVANGTFGKLGSMWSIMYAPNLMIQVTITGQLCILMLAERFELAGIEVTSVNTDGIVVRCHKSKEHLYYNIVKQWEKETGLETEEVRYLLTCSRDINNYIAVYETPQKGEIFKTKGAYGKTSPKKNAIAEICVEAVKQFIAAQVPVTETIRACRNITKFTSMRHVAGGAVKGYEFNYIGKDQVKGGIKNGLYLGKLIRWYYAKGEQGEIVYAKTGNRVALTEGAKPLMNLPAEFPDDVNYDWYEAEAYKILKQIGFLKDEISDETVVE